MTKKAKPISNNHSRISSDPFAGADSSNIDRLLKINSDDLDRRPVMPETNETIFIISADPLPTIVEARNQLITWLWKQALQEAKGNTKRAAEILGVTDTYVNFLGRRIRSGLPPTGARKNCGNRKANRAAVQSILDPNIKASAATATEKGE